MDDGKLGEGRRLLPAVLLLVAACEGGSLVEDPSQISMAVVPKISVSTSLVGKKAMKSPTSVLVDETGLELSPDEQRPDEPQVERTQSGAESKPSVMERIEARRARQRVAERALQEMHQERFEKLREDPEYQRARLAQLELKSPDDLGGTPREVSRDERIWEHLRTRFQQAVSASDVVTAESLLEDMRAFDPEADLMHDFLMLKTKRQQLSLDRP